MTLLIREILNIKQLSIKQIGQNVVNNIHNEFKQLIELMRMISSQARGLSFTYLKLESNLNIVLSEDAFLIEINGYSLTLKQKEIVRACILNAIERSE